jgi:ATP-binding cassette subfamily F protein uup
MTILMTNPNFLILDEPTNDLDIFILCVLEEYLASFQGCLIIVSHDRYFLDKIVGHTFYFEGNGKIKDVLGNYTAYRKFLKEREANEKLENKKSEEKKEANKSKVVEAPVEKKKLSYKEKIEYEGLEKEMEDLSTENTTIAEKMNSGITDTEEIKKMSLRMSEIATLLETKENRWLELSEYA